MVSIQVSYRCLSRSGIGIYPGQLLMSMQVSYWCLSRCAIGVYPDEL